MITIKISKDFRYAPGPRLIREGINSGQEFREKILRDAVRKAIANNEKLVVDLDGTAGYGRSFLEEAFGGLIREDRIPYADIVRVLTIVSNDQPSQTERIMDYLRKAHEKDQRQVVSTS
jgi:hypothetical protein